MRRPGPAARALGAARIPASAAAVRALAVVELATAGAGLTLPGRDAGAVLAAAFACLAAGAVIGGRTAAELACGCFGDEDGASLGPRHALTSLTAAVAAGAAAWAAPPSLLHTAGRRPAEALAALAGGALIAAALRAWLRGATLHGSAVSLVDASARVLEARFSRRTALQRVAVAGSALAVAPLRYLLYPGTALGVVVPGSCQDGLCTDGYTAFCCEINDGINGCPEGTFIGGWWKCTDYRGHQLCSSTGVRYYIDCNALPHQPFPGGCRCANGSCAHRRQACNVFRYGQCNTHIKGTTAVVCRMVTCENPGRIPHLGCSHALMVDDAVCGHEAGCLEPLAVQLPGVGGA